MITGLVVLSDFAQQDSTGKVNMLGASWSEIGPGPSQQGVVVFLKVPSERAAAGPIPVRLRLLQANGEIARIPAIAGMQQLEIAGQLELEPAEGWEPERKLNAAFQVNLSPISLAPGPYS